MRRSRSPTSGLPKDGGGAQGSLVRSILRTGATARSVVFAAMTGLCRMGPTVPLGPREVPKSRLELTDLDVAFLPGAEARRPARVPSAFSTPRFRSRCSGKNRSRRIGNSQACRFLPISKPSALVHAHTGVSCISSSARVVVCVGAQGEAAQGRHRR